HGLPGQQLSAHAMLRIMGNMRVSGNKLTKAALDVLQTCLPEGWQVNAIPAYGAYDAQLEVRAPDGRAGKVAVQTKRSLEPRTVLELRDRLRSTGTDGPALVLAPYLSPAVRQRL